VGQSWPSQHGVAAQGVAPLGAECGVLVGFSEDVVAGPGAGDGASVQQGQGVEGAEQRCRAMWLCARC
jgi:hypothetical protein